MGNNAGYNYDEPTINDRLHTALALNRGLEFIEDFKAKASNPPDVDRSKREKAINDLYLSIHKALYRDSHNHPLETPLAGNAIGGKSDRLREILNEFAGSLFNRNGSMQKLERGETGHADNVPTLEMALAKVYRSLQQLKPFDYGNRETTNLFIDAVGRMRGFVERYGSSIDFRRLDNEDVRVLNDAHSPDAALIPVFTHALDPSRTPELSDPSEFIAWKDKTVMVGGVPFLGHKEDGKDYLVTVNGGLVELASIQDGLIDNLRKPESLISEYRVMPDKYLTVKTRDEHGEKTDYIKTHDKHGKEIYLKDKHFVDGYEVTDGKAPLVCLEADIITGLSKPNLKRLMDYISQQRDKDFPITRLKDDDEARWLTNEAPENIKELLKVVTPHVREITIQMDDAKHHMIEASQPVINPHLFMSMGGCGSGKDDVGEIAQAYCGTNYVEASLDKSREASDLYRLMQAVGHHADDYTTIEPMASALRNWVASAALEANLNLVYDGTGVPFKNRYDKIIKEYKNKGYQTMVCAVDTMLVTPEDRKTEYSASLPAIDRVVLRANTDKTGRALPWSVVVGKHLKVMRSLLEASELPEADKTIMLCNDGPKGKGYILAESFNMNKEKLRALKHAESAGKLRDSLTALMHDDPSSVAMALARHRSRQNGARSSEEAFRDIISKIPAFDENNIGMLARRISGSERVLGITNMVRMIDLAEKGLMNIEAAGPQTLTHKMRDLAFIVPTDSDLSNGYDAAHLALQKPSRHYQEKVSRAFGSGAGFEK